MSILTALLHPREWLIDHVFAGTLKDAAEGKYGDRAKSIYWWVQKRAAVWGVVAAVLDLLLRGLTQIGVCPNCAQWDKWLLSACALLASAGVLVGFHAAEAPERQ